MINPSKKTMLITYAVAAVLTILFILSITVLRINVRKFDSK